MTRNRAPQPSGPLGAARPYSTWWLLAREGEPGKGLITVGGDIGGALAAFSHEEEARMFLRFAGVDGDRWHVRETPAGELVSLLLGHRADLYGVALDPLPGMAEAGTIDLVMVERKRFVCLVIAGGERRYGSTSRRSHLRGWSRPQEARHPNPRSR